MKLSNENLFNALSLIGAMLLISIIATSCQDRDPLIGDSYEYVLLIDVSKSYEDSKSSLIGDILHSALMKEMGIEENSPTNIGARIYFSYMGKSYLPIVSKAELESKIWMLNPRKDRINEVNTFYNLSKQQTNDLLSRNANDQISNLYRGMLNGLSQMDHSAQHRKMIVMADYLESSVILEMGDYLKQPEKLQTDYEKLKSLLVASEPISDEFKGTEIILICPEYYLVSYEAAKFWRRFFEEHGLIVSIRPSY
ncbi:MULTISPECIES: hypothetical protein [Roseivirga]|uniref:VWFA domain-containing protein n=1 Tax=Roseivirga spongicola TaxID=333140 RepID=A0A150XFM7_9BACT|nr:MULTISPECIES: hypothetical protein [Roseivirga]KYG77494.1 hypothetical protein AWW68_01620 [Roseivirga spongicola]MBO6661707.1 hypothetical protein [Roseivirga sp.]MBO6908308.1 hypothetical protein [Roseivirga sp.]WPZ11203.1 hypothetical protein T7867_03695 [Roseivirga spongicola]